MIVDIWTVMCKEWQELLHQQQSIRKTVLVWLATIALIAIFSSWLTGRDWVETRISFGFWILLPSLLVWATIPDSFAGERERHTLETLLASRLPDRAILLGKIGAVVSHACGLTLVFFLLALVTVNLKYWGDPLLLYAVDPFLAGMGVSLLTSTLIASLGIPISLHAATVKQASMTLGLAMYLLSGVGFAILLLLPRLIKLKVISPPLTGWIIVAILVGLDSLLIAAAMTRFQRSQLILD